MRVCPLNTIILLYTAVVVTSQMCPRINHFQNPIDSSKVGVLILVKHISKILAILVMYFYLYEVKLKMLFHKMTLPTYSSKIPCAL